MYARNGNDLEVIPSYNSEIDDTENKRANSLGMENRRINTSYIT